MTKDEIKDKVISMLGTLGCDTSITMESSLEGDLRMMIWIKLSPSFTSKTSSVYLSPTTSGTK